MTKSKADLPAAVRDELRRVVTVFAFGQVWLKASMGLKEQEADVWRTFHGHDKIKRPAHKDMLVAGEGMNKPYMTPGNWQ